MWLGGQQPSKDDAEKFTTMGSAPSAETHPESHAWYILISRFSEDVRSSWTAAAPAQPAGGKKGGKGGA